MEDREALSFREKVRAARDKAAKELAERKKIEAVYRWKERAQLRELIYGTDQPMQAAETIEKPAEAQDKVIQTSPKRVNLEKDVVPILMQAMSECAKKRPANPIEFVAKYLLENNPEQKN